MARGLFRHPPLPQVQRRRVSQPEPPPSLGTCGLIVANSASLTAGDLILKGRIEAVGYTVTSFSASASEDTGKTIYVIAESVATATLGTKYRNSASPVLNLNGGSNANLDLATGASTNTGDQTTVDIIDAGHDLAAGLSGTGVTFASAGSQVNYNGFSELGAGATSVVAPPGLSASDATIYAYESGATMANAHGTAEARRAYYGLALDTDMADLDANGIALLDAAITWIGGTAGGTLYNRTLTDAIGLADAVVRVGTLLRTVADSLSLGNAVVRVGTFLRTAGDSLTLGNTVARVGTFARTAADSLGFSDAVTRLGTFLRTAADSLSFSDAVSGVKLVVRTAADSLAISDAVVRVGTFLRTAADSLTLGNTVTRAGTFARTAADSLSLGDTVSRVGTFLRTVADSLSFSDAVSGVKTYVRTLADSVGFGDSVSRVGTFTRTLADSLTVGNTVARVGTFLRTAADSLSVSEVVVGARTYFRTATDSLGFSDAVVGVRTFVRSLADSLAIGDTVSRTVAASRTLTDSLSLAETVSRVLSAVRSLADSLGITDAISYLTDNTALGGIPPRIAYAVHAVARAARYVAHLRTAPRAGDVDDVTATAPRTTTDAFHED